MSKNANKFNAETLAAAVRTAMGPALAKAQGATPSNRNAINSAVNFMTQPGPLRAWWDRKGDALVSEAAQLNINGAKKVGRTLRALVNGCAYADDAACEPGARNFKDASVSVFGRAILQADAEGKPHTLKSLHHATRERYNDIAQAGYTVQALRALGVVASAGKGGAITVANRADLAMLAGADKGAE